MTDEANILALMHSSFTLVNYHWFIILLSSRKKGKDFCRAVSWQETLTFTINLWMIRKGFHIQFSAQSGSSLTNQMYMVLHPSKQWIFLSVRNIVLSCYIEGSPGKKTDVKRFSSSTHTCWKYDAAIHTCRANEKFFLHFSTKYLWRASDTSSIWMYMLLKNGKIHSIFHWIKINYSR